MNRFILPLNIILALGLLAAGCAPSTPEKVIETVMVTKEVPVEVTKIVEATKEVVATATPTPSVVPGTITAYILIFSGREDPEWEISNPDDIETLRGFLVDLPLASPPDWPTLGWRGVLLRNNGVEDFPLLMHVFDGVIEVYISEGSIYLEDFRGMENWLLERMPMPTPAPSPIPPDRSLPILWQELLSLPADSDITGLKEALIKALDQTHKENLLDFNETFEAIREVRGLPDTIPEGGLREDQLPNLKKAADKVK